MAETTKSGINNGNSARLISRHGNNYTAYTKYDEVTSSETTKRIRSKRLTADEDETSEDYPSSSETDVASTASSASNFYRTTDCTSHDLYVDFEKIGWSSWIIAPKGYNAFYCKGKCSFPLGQNQRPTNHATVQSIIHELHLHDDIEMPCCVPNKLFSLSLLYIQGNGYLVLKQYEDMVAGGCGCH